MSDKKLLVFHPTIAPYRIDFFNDLYEAFNTIVCLQYKNLKSQKFDYDKISRQFLFKPAYLPERNKISLLRGVRHEISSYAPEIVLTCEFGIITIFALVWRWIIGKKYKVIVMTDDSFDMLVGGNDFSMRHRVARRLLSFWVDDLIVANPDVKQWFQQHYGKGIYFPIIKNEVKARELYRSALPFGKSLVEQYALNKKNVFLFVGRLVELKNVDNVIRAFANLNQNENVLVVIGSGPEEGRLRCLAKDIGSSVIFTGRLEGNDLYAWYNLAQVLVLASYKEPFGAVTNEALLAGCRVLISKKAGSSCLVENGVNGFVFDPMDTEDLSNAMQKILTLPKVKVNGDGIRINQMMCNYQIMMETVINAIDRV